MKTIKIKYHDDLVTIGDIYDLNIQLNKLKKGDWIDLRAAERVVLKAGDYRIIRLGISMALPKGYEGLLLPRSSTFKNWGILLVNGMGVIDNSYNGDFDEWGFPAYATRDTVIEPGERICQFRIQKNMPNVKFKVRESLSSVCRGGYGSSGRI